MENTLVIIDGNSLLNRAYYAIQRPMITGDGLYTQGIFGFLNMLNKITTDYSLSYITVAFDRKAPTFRHLQYKEYKAGRKKMPPELAMQFPVLKEVLAAMKIHMLEIDGFEADDIIGTVAVRAEEAGLSPLIITGDRDALQLATDVTKIIFTKRGISEFEVYDRKAMLERYGLTPDQFIDLKGLMGDASDNIPGIPGVGEKTATKLLLEYGSVENLIASVDTMKKSKLKEKIEENADLAVMSKRLATINTNVPIEVDFEAMRCQEPDRDKLIEMYKRLEFNSFLRKMIKSEDAKEAAGASANDNTSNDASADMPGSIKNGAPADADGATPQTAQIQDTQEMHEIPPEFSYLFSVSSEAKIIRTESKEDFERMSESLSAKEAVWLYVFHDNAHIRRPQVSSVCLASDDTMYFIPTDKSAADGSGESAAARGLDGFFRSFGGQICGHNLKSCYYALISMGAASLAQGNDTIFRTGFDTEVAEYILEPQKRSYEMSQLALEYFHEKFPSDEEIAEETSAIDLFGRELEKQESLGLKILSLSSRLSLVQSQRLGAEKLVSVCTQIEFPLIEVLADMEHTGIRVDAEALEEIGIFLREKIQQITDVIYTAAGSEFNINSPKQLGAVLFDDLGLPPGKKTKSGYSTNAEELERLAKDYPIAANILEFRMLTKLNGTYVDGMLPLISSEGRIHAHFQQTVTMTGRLSCTEPNLQNIPVRQELGRILRKAFTASDSNHILVGADYSQIELRIMAHLSQDPALIKAFKDNQDIHSTTAARVFDIPQDEVTPLMRSRAKAVNFGVIYGISAFGLASDLKISRAEAQKYIDDYFKKHPKVKEYMERMMAECRKNGFATTMYGRRRKISEIHASNRITRQLGERLAMNTPVQGTAADIMKLAMSKTYRRLNVEVPEAKIILQVHDELTLDVPSDLAQKAGKILEESMCGAAELDIPLIAEVNTGNDWYSIK